MRWRKLTVRALCESAGRARVSLARSCLPGASATGRADLESRRRKLDTRAHRVRRRRSLDTVAAARAGQQACLNCRANGRWTCELRSGAPHEFQLSKRSLKTNAICMTVSDFNVGGFIVFQKWQRRCNRASTVIACI